MDDIRRANLSKQRDKIIKDLQVDHILDDLYSLQTVTADDLEEVRNKSLRKDQVASLLTIIAKKDNRAYDNFVHVLRKDYDWLFKALKDCNDNGNDISDKLEQNAFQDTLVLGNVPRRPPHYVNRTAPLNNLRGHLRELEPCQRIVLHGMTGSGKSCLAAAAVKDPYLLQNHFQNRVFWINLGEIKVVEQLPMHMNLLLQILLNDSRDLHNKPRPASFITQEGDTVVEIQLLKTALKNILCVGAFRDALLILDNVSLRQATEAFDVGCKTLITTQVKDIIIGNNTVYMEVKGGFTENETLSLFAKSLQTDIGKLPLQAAKIHYLCKGEPILISLIGSLLEPYKEDLLKNDDHWEYYINRLTNKDYNLKAQLFGAISICIERLNSELQQLYYNFAIFVEDVNITPQVMETLWNLNSVYAVQEKIVELQNKSLIVSYYNQELNSYVYGVHDLFLAYLKETLGVSRMIEQHKNLIYAYKHITNNNFANLPNDNYIFQYIGYHLKEAQLYDEFAIYFDLNFIGAKIKAIGIADLLRDFQLYKAYITRNDTTLTAKLSEYINFVKAKGHDLFKYKDTDIIQCGLGQDKDSCIFKAAINITKQNPKSLYLQLQAPQESVYFTHTLDLQQDVSAACFTVDVNQILVGMSNGDINLWEQAYNQKLYVFSGHTDAITYLQLSSYGNGFLSVSHDGTAKIWSLDGVVLRNSNGETFDENGFHRNIPSPRIKQRNWTNFYGTNGRVDRSKTCSLAVNNSEDKIISASYSNDTENYVVTGCFSGRVLIWDILNENPAILCDIAGHGQPAGCVIFSADDSYIIFSCDSSIFLYNSQNGDFLSKFNNKVDIKSLLIVPELETTLIAISYNTIKIWTWNQIGYTVLNPTSNELDQRDQASFLCGAVTDDGMYLVAGSTDYYIRIWHIGTSKIVQEILNNKGLVVCLDTFYDDTKNAVHILLSGSDDKTVKQWHIQPTLQNSDIAKLLPIFDCFWNASSGVPRIAVVNTLNKVQLMNGHNIIIESERMESPIKTVRFSLCGNKVAIGLESGDVIEYDYKNRHYEKLMKLHDSVMLLKYFKTTNHSEHHNNIKNNINSEKNILIATAQNGWVSIYKNGHALCLVQPPPLKSLNLNFKQMAVVPVVQCFYINAAGKFLSVSQNRIIKSWNVEDGSCSILFGNKIYQNDTCGGVVTMATLSMDQSLLAITLADGCFEIYSVTVHNYSIILTLNQEKSLNDALRSCRFSHNGKILALGQDNGNIVIWSVESKISLGTLFLHKSWVRYLLFSPQPALILISVGDQIAWWDLTKMPEPLQNKDRHRKRTNSTKKNLIIDTTTRMSNLNLGAWYGKEGKSDKPHLLSAIKVRGLFSTYISASQDFTSFFTVDKNGYLYIMEMLTTQV